MLPVYQLREKIFVVLNVDKKKSEGLPLIVIDFSEELASINVLVGNMNKTIYPSFWLQKHTNHVLLFFINSLAIVELNLLFYSCCPVASLCIFVLVLPQRIGNKFNSCILL